MSLNTIELPGTVIADLFKKSLVEFIDDSNAADVALMEVTTIIGEPATVNKTPAALQYLGKNLQQVTILVQYKDHVYLPEEQLDFLSTILKACQLNLGDIAIVNTATQTVNFETLVKDLGTKQLLLFGIEPGAIGLDASLVHFSIKLVNEVPIVAVMALDVLNKNNDEGKLLKSKLWLCLKQLFNMK